MSESAVSLTSPAIATARQIYKLARVSRVARVIARTAPIGIGGSQRRWWWWRRLAPRRAWARGYAFAGGGPDAKVVRGSDGKGSDALVWVVDEQREGVEPHLRKGLQVAEVQSTGRCIAVEATGEGKDGVHAGRLPLSKMRAIKDDLRRQRQIIRRCMNLAQHGIEVLGPPWQTVAPIVSGAAGRTPCRILDLIHHIVVNRCAAWQTRTASLDPATAVRCTRDRPTRQPGAEIASIGAKNSHIARIEDHANAARCTSLDG